MTLTLQIPLANGLTLEVWDLSRPVAADTHRVELLMRVVTGLEPGDFAHPDHYARMRQLHGDRLAYEHRLVRSYVPEAQREAVTQELRAAFQRDQLPYLGRPDFRQRFARARYREIARHFRDNETTQRETTA